MKIKNLILIPVLSVFIFTACEDTKKKEQEKAQAEQAEMEREAALKADEEQRELEGNSIVAKAMEADSLSTLSNALKKADISETLRTDRGPFTVFAPTDAAFSEVGQEKLDSLMMNENQDELAGLLEYHVVEDEITSDELSQQIQSNNGEYTFNTMAGEDITAMMSGENIVLRDANGNMATITQADVDASNGVVHIIDAVIMKKKS
ncbi:fasciclin domain-containing protein [Salegentibacter sp. F188]|uniref:Fasciclin domain-containing protein n=1 Tax=Autumnicola patrickiae TaxID=3075591 RepID=A0ABU3DYT8_9FLAO|nr:fasciclin domain-containing protein [Salegentibacter sp. F188]MDT0688884.1 fasciclin domain-containing protein [Salegentibacter sp. F188]